MTTRPKKTAATMVSEAKTRVENLTPEQVARELESRLLSVSRPKRMQHKFYVRREEPKTRRSI